MCKRIFVLLTISILLSCKKDVPIIIGCTDSTALNYNDSANYDGSCLYDTLTKYYTTPYAVVVPPGFPNMDIPENNPIKEANESAKNILDTIKLEERRNIARIGRIILKEWKINCKWCITKSRS